MGEITLNSIYHSYTNIQTVMDILMCCGQGGDNSKFHISLIHKHSDNMDILMCCGQGGDNSKFHISLIHKHSDSYGYIDVLWTALNSIYHSYTLSAMDILVCCGQGGDNSKFHISHIYKHSDSYGYIDVLWTRGRQL